MPSQPKTRTNKGTHEEQPAPPPPPVPPPVAGDTSDDTSSPDDPNDPDFNVGTALQGGQDPPTSHRQCRKAQDQYCDLGGAFSYEQFFHVSMDYALQYARKAAR